MFSTQTSPNWKRIAEELGLTDNGRLKSLAFMYLCVQTILDLVEEARSLIRDGYIPQVRALACNNGLKWNPSAQEAIERSGFGEQVTWEHVNHGNYSGGRGRRETGSERKT
ncbi:MAG: hypothetical protein JJU32_06620, partial [Phormidium sp. BM_Day4_Bin.17]|nr:hypothetical protein [Phormidium sp. BM_Day4_Bin.17]UCJ11310.1 MAG: hypothetical protein JWS08_16230 [Phormidium sp. PBR-2020]